MIDKKTDIESIRAVKQIMHDLIFYIDDKNLPVVESIIEREIRNLLERIK